MSSIPARFAIVLGGLILGACSDDEVAAPDSVCEFSGITSRDAAGILIGSEDPDDWCPEVMANPNPAAAGAVMIRMTLAQDEQVRIAVRDPVAGEIQVLLDGMLPAGEHAITWDLTSVSSGIYCVTVESVSLSCSGDVEIL